MKCGDKRYSNREQERQKHRKREFQLPCWQLVRELLALNLCASCKSRVRAQDCKRTDSLPSASAGFRHQLQAQDSCAKGQHTICALISSESSCTYRKQNWAPNSDFVGSRGKTLCSYSSPDRMAASEIAVIPPWESLKNEA